MVAAQGPGSRRFTAPAPTGGIVSCWDACRGSPCASRGRAASGTSSPRASSGFGLVRAARSARPSVILRRRAVVSAGMPGATSRWMPCLPPAQMRCAEAGACAAAAVPAAGPPFAAAPAADCQLDARHCRSCLDDSFGSDHGTLVYVGDDVVGADGLLGRDPREARQGVRNRRRAVGVGLDQHPARVGLVRRFGSHVNSVARRDCRAVKGLFRACHNWRAGEPTGHITAARPSRGRRLQGHAAPSSPVQLEGQRE